MKTKKVLIAGGYGAAMVIGQSIADANLRGYNEYEFCGFINDRAEEKFIGEYPVKGGFSDIPRLKKEGYCFISAIHKIGGQKLRSKLFDPYSLDDKDFATFIHPLAYVSPDVEIHSGTVVLANASISSGATIGKMTLIMSNVSIGHNNKIGDHCFFTANSCAGSYLNIGKGVWIGLNSTILGKLHIGDYSAIGAGAVITKNIGEDELWIGNPGRFHKNVSDKINM
ncbi:MAG: acetyltransferase [Candidatus Marinimicrobia bacterium]|nr:acetyltransferase [Candidatus Neomarinimicrobiota bacterium]